MEGDLGTILDARATAEYKKRLAEARRELDAAIAASDLGQAARARLEIETITEQLTAAYGLGGRPRTAGDPAERLRQQSDWPRPRPYRRRAAELGRHLTNALRTGFVCVYRPAPGGVAAMRLTVVLGATSASVSWCAGASPSARQLGEELPNREHLDITKLRPPVGQADKNLALETLGAIGERCQAGEHVG